ncbi:MAG: DUF6152 family protein [Acidobacteriota bacterium]
MSLYYTYRHNFKTVLDIWYYNRWSTLCVTLCLVGLPLQAHHSTAPFDMTRESTISGIVSEFRWTNPHSYIYLEAAEGGEMRRWVLEAESLNLLRRNGWSKESVKKGDRISCLGARAKDTSVYAMKCFTVIFPDGRRLLATPTGVPSKAPVK